MINTELVIEQTKNWIRDVVIGCNFCPFAGREFANNTIRYAVDTNASLKAALVALVKECDLLDQDASIITTLIIFPNGYKTFDDYLQLLSLGESLLEKEGYEGIYQLASFHPLYQFEGDTADDPSNYTNRSVYPMLQILREASLDEALKNYSAPEKIPEQNVIFTRSKGVDYMKMLLDKCK